MCISQTLVLAKIKIFTSCQFNPYGSDGGAFNVDVTGFQGCCVDLLKPEIKMNRLIAAEARDI